MQNTAAQKHFYLSGLNLMSYGRHPNDGLRDKKKLSQKIRVESVKTDNLRTPNTSYCDLLNEYQAAAMQL